jgi:hypothetical protein
VVYTIQIFTPLFTPAELADGLGLRDNPTPPLAGIRPNYLGPPSPRRGLGDLLNVEYIYEKRVVNINLEIKRKMENVRRKINN